MFSKIARVKGIIDMSKWKAEITKIEEMFERNKSKELLPIGFPDAFATKYWAISRELKRAESNIDRRIANLTINMLASKNAEKMISIVSKGKWEGDTIAVIMKEFNLTEKDAGRLLNFHLKDLAFPKIKEVSAKLSAILQEKNEIEEYKKGLERFEVPAGIVAIYDYCFNDCLYLKEVILQDSLTRIGRYAFAGCTALETIYIPESVSDIEYTAFIGCKKLIISANAQSYAFKWAKLTKNEIEVVEQISVDVLGE